MTTPTCQHCGKNIKKPLFPKEQVSYVWEGKTYPVAPRGTLKQLHRPADHRGQAEPVLVVYVQETEPS